PRAASDSPLSASGDLPPRRTDSRTSRAPHGRTRARSASTPPACENRRPGERPFASSQATTLFPFRHCISQRARAPRLSSAHVWLARNAPAIAARPVLTRAHTRLVRANALSLHMLRQFRRTGSAGSAGPDEGPRFGVL